MTYTYFDPLGLVKLDLRMVLGLEFHGEQPTLILCPLHDDSTASMGVYSDHLYCYACRRFIRQQAGLALLLGYWDGLPETELAAVRAVRHRIPGFTSQQRPIVRPKKRARLDPGLPMVFHRYMMQTDRWVDLLLERGYAPETMLRYCLGHTGTHWTIPVYDASGVLICIRFRSDPRFTCEEKYSALCGYNPVVPYSLPYLRPCSSAWIVEGEYDSITLAEMGVMAVTITGGADQLRRLPGLLPKFGVQEWIIATDLDEAGERAAYELLALLPGRRAWWPIGKDMTEFRMSGGTLQDVEYH